MATYQHECDALTYRTIRNTLCRLFDKVTEAWGEIFEELAKEGGPF